MIEHLLLSTLILLIAIAAARILPLTARTRHALLLAGLAKFALPSSAIAALLRAAGVDPAQSAIAIPIGVFGGGAQSPLASPSPDLPWLTIAWAAIALLIFARWLILRRRTVAAALRASGAPSARELDALTFARRAFRIAMPVDLVRSPLCEAPAVLRVIRPVVALPASGCDALDDDELRTLLLHECAHIARRDNFVSMLETLAGALLWFNPFVWLALRDLATTREEACDEAVSDAVEHPDAYLGALTKICQSAVATRTAGASCMASSRLKERIEHLMRYAQLKHSALSHRAVIAAAIAGILAITTAATALETKKSELQQLYTLNFRITPGNDRVAFDIDVVERASGNVVARPKINAAPGQLTTVNVDHGTRDIELRVQSTAGGKAMLFIDVTENEQLVQRNLYTYDPESVTRPKPAAKKATGSEPISLTLKDASLRDVMNTFSQLTGYELDMPEGIDGRVTISVVGEPWDKALHEIAKQTDTKITIDGKTIRVRK